MTSPSKKLKKEKRVKAWALIDKDGLSTIFVSPFNQPPFAIYSKDAKFQLNREIMKKYKVKVVECVITYKS